MGYTPEQLAWTQAEAKRHKWWGSLITPIAGTASQHRVRISRPFFLGVYLVTQAEYERIMGRNPSAHTSKQVDVASFHPPLKDLEKDKEMRENKARKFAGRDSSRNPVDTVSWGDAIEFCRRLSMLPDEQTAHHYYQLPTEAQWEFACRAGTTTRWSCGDEEKVLREYAWFDGSGAPPGTCPVGQKRPNPWGLYDMHGNLWEWCFDNFDVDYYRHSPAVDPTGRPDGGWRVLRGGTITTQSAAAQSAFRYSYGQSARNPVYGFRICRPATE